ncbi:hypothetical protein C6A85_42610, partial [Mycobacterium sp. ITM-2017-0098]
PSVSVEVTAPVTTPVLAFGVPELETPIGAAFFGATVTVTSTGTVPPLPSLTVTVNASCFNAAAALFAAAACRAASVGVYTNAPLA